MRSRKLVDADDVASVCGVSRKTVLREASRNGGAFPLGNKMFVTRASVRSILDGREVPDVENAPGILITLQQCAAMIGCSRSTVLRVLMRIGGGVKVGKRRYVSTKNVAAIKANISKPGLPIRFQNPKEMREHASRMARKLWRSRKSPDSL